MPGAGPVTTPRSISSATPRLRCRTLTGTAADGRDFVAPVGEYVGEAVGEYERQMRVYGYAAGAASSQAEAEAGMRRNRPKLWLYRRARAAAEAATS